MNKSRISKIAAVILSVLLAVVLSSSASAQSNGREDKVIAKSDDSPFGVLEFLHWNHAWNSYKYPDEKSLSNVIALMKEAGVKWVRMDFLWQDIEPAQGKFDYAKYDLIVKLLNENKINLLGILNYNVDWQAANCKWNAALKDDSSFVNYVSHTINRYKGKVKYWEIWNEPDSFIYWQPQDGLKSYCRLLKDCYLEAKKIDPECKILNGGLANPALSVNQLYDNGAKDYFDILNIHIFDSLLNNGAIKRVLAYPKLAYKIMKRNGDKDKKIWVTEIGCPGVKWGVRTNNWWLGKNPNEKQQSEWLSKVYCELIKLPAVEKVFWAFFRDTHKHWDSGIDYFGLLRWDLSKKAAFKAYKKCALTFNESSRREEK